MRNGGVVEIAHLLGRTAFEADGATVGKARGFAVDWLGHAKGAAVVPVEEPRVAAARLVAQRLTCAERAEHRVVETF